MQFVEASWGSSESKIERGRLCEILGNVLKERGCIPCLFLFLVAWNEDKNGNVGNCHGPLRRVKSKMEGARAPVPGNME